MRSLGIFCKKISNHAYKTAAFLFVFIFVFIAFFGICGCADEDCDVEIGGDFRTVSIYDTDVVKVVNLTTDSEGHKKFGVVCGDLWQAYVGGGTGYVVYYVKPEKGKTFESLELDLEAYFSSNGAQHIYAYEETDDNGNYKTNITVEYSYNGKDKEYAEIYNLRKVAGDDFERANNEYIGENALKINLLPYYSEKNGGLYVKIKCTHMCYADFSEYQKAIYSSIFGNMVNGAGTYGGKGIELHRLAIRLYSAFIRGDYSDITAK